MGKSKNQRNRGYRDYRREQVPQTPSSRALQANYSKKPAVSHSPVLDTITLTLRTHDKTLATLFFVGLIVSGCLLDGVAAASSSSNKKASSSGKDQKQKNAVAERHDVSHPTIQNSKMAEILPQDVSSAALPNSPLMAHMADAYKNAFAHIDDMKSALKSFDDNKMLALTSKNIPEDERATVYAHVLEGQRVSFRGVLKNWREIIDALIIKERNPYLDAYIQEHFGFFLQPQKDPELFSIYEEVNFSPYVKFKSALSVDPVLILENSSQAEGELFPKPGSTELIAISSFHDHELYVSQSFESTMTLTIRPSKGIKRSVDIDPQMQKTVLARIKKFLGDKNLTSGGVSADSISEIQNLNAFNQFIDMDAFVKSQYYLAGLAGTFQGDKEIYSVFKKAENENLFVGTPLFFLRHFAIEHGREDLFLNAVSPLVSRIDHMLNMALGQNQVALLEQKPEEHGGLLQPFKEAEAELLTTRKEFEYGYISSSRAAGKSGMAYSRMMDYWELLIANTQDFQLKAKENFPKAAYDETLRSFQSTEEIMRKSLLDYWTMIQKEAMDYASLMDQHHFEIFFNRMMKIFLRSASLQEPKWYSELNCSPYARFMVEMTNPPKVQLKNGVGENEVILKQGEQRFLVVSSSYDRALYVTKISDDELLFEVMPYQGGEHSLQRDDKIKGPCIRLLGAFLEKVHPKAVNALTDIHAVNIESMQRLNAFQQFIDEDYFIAVQLYLAILAGYRGDNVEIYPVFDSSVVVVGESKLYPSTPLFFLLGLSARYQKVDLFFKNLPDFVKMMNQDSITAFVLGNFMLPKPQNQAETLLRNEIYNLFLQTRHAGHYFYFRVAIDFFLSLTGRIIQKLSVSHLALAGALLYFFNKRRHKKTFQLSELGVKFEYDTQKKEWNVQVVQKNITILHHGKSLAITAANREEYKKMLLEFVLSLANETQQFDNRTARKKIHEAIYVQMILPTLKSFFEQQNKWLAKTPYKVFYNGTTKDMDCEYDETKEIPSDKKACRDIYEIMTDKIKNADIDEIVSYVAEVQKVFEKMKKENLLKTTITTLSFASHENGEVILDGDMLSNMQNVFNELTKLQFSATIEKNKIKVRMENHEDLALFLVKLNQEKIDNEKSKKAEEKKSKIQANFLSIKAMFSFLGDIWRLDGAKLCLVERFPDIKLEFYGANKALTRAEVNNLKEIIKVDFLPLMNKEVDSLSSQAIAEILSQVKELQHKLLLLYYWLPTLTQLFHNRLGGVAEAAFVFDKHKKAISLTIHPLNNNVEVCELLKTCLKSELHAFQSNVNEDLEFTFTAEASADMDAYFLAVLERMTRIQTARNRLQSMNQLTLMLGDSLFTIEDENASNPVFSYDQEKQKKELSIGQDTFELLPLFEDQHFRSEAEIAKVFQSYMQRIFKESIAKAQEILKQIHEHISLKLEKVEGSDLILALDLKMVSPKLLKNEIQNKIKRFLVDEDAREENGRIIFSLIKWPAFMKVLSDYVDEKKKKESKSDVKHHSSTLSLKKVPSFFKETGSSSSSHPRTMFAAPSHSQKAGIGVDDLMELIQLLSSHKLEHNNPVTQRVVAMVLLKIVVSCHEILKDFLEGKRLAEHRNSFVHQICFAVKFGFDISALRDFFVNLDQEKARILLVQDIKDQIETCVTSDQIISKTTQWQDTVAILEQELLFIRQQNKEPDVLVFSLFLIGEFWTSDCSRSTARFSPEERSFFDACHEFRNQFAHTAGHWHEHQDAAKRIVNEFSELFWPTPRLNPAAKLFIPSTF